MGGWKKRGGCKTSQMTPLPKRSFGPPPPLYGTFSTCVRCQCSVFPVQKSPISSFGGVQKFSGECVLWYAFLPPYVLHPPIFTAQLENLKVEVAESHQRVERPIEEKKELNSGEARLAMSEEDLKASVTQESTHPPVDGKVPGKY